MAFNTLRLLSSTFVRKISALIACYMSQSALFTIRSFRARSEVTCRIRDGRVYTCSFFNTEKSCFACICVARSHSVKWTSFTSWAIKTLFKALGSLLVSICSWRARYFIIYLIVIILFLWAIKSNWALLSSSHPWIGTVFTFFTSSTFFLRYISCICSRFTRYLYWWSWRSIITSLSSIFCFFLTSKWAIVTTFTKPCRCWSIGTQAIRAWSTIGTIISWFSSFEWIVFSIRTFLRSYWSYKAIPSSWTNISINFFNWVRSWRSWSTIESCITISTNGSHSSIMTILSRIAERTFRWAFELCIIWICSFGARLWEISSIWAIMSNRTVSISWETLSRTIKPSQAFEAILNTLS